MDSLLKEIDDEMENTGEPEWKIPLQEIGDETMEMIVNQNYRENQRLEQVGERNSTRIISTGISSPSEKGDAFTEGIKSCEDRKEQGKLETEGEEDFLSQRLPQMLPSREECGNDLLEERLRYSSSPVNSLSSNMALADVVKANSFNLKGTAKDSRLSTASSYGGSGSDLETSTIDDKYKLLEDNSLDGDKTESISPSITEEHSPSNACDLVTDYESARESVNDTESELVNEHMNDSDVYLDVVTRATPSIDGAESLVSSHHNDMLADEEESYKSPDTSVNNSDGSYTLEKVGEDSKNTICYEDVQELLSPRTPEKTKDNATIPEEENSESMGDLNDFTGPAENMEVSDGCSHNSRGFNADAKKDPPGQLPCSKKKPPNSPLLPMLEAGPIFNEDPFEDVFDSSGDSLDLTRSVKPIDYISIWHHQANNFKPHSRPVSVDSQFSERSFSSKSSVSAPRTEFRFVSRIVSRCRYYNPDRKQELYFDSDVDDDDGDDDVIYTVDHAMDPKIRNALISKQTRNSIRNNKKANPLRLAAIGIQAENSRGHEKDDGGSPFDNYPVTLSPTKDGNTPAGRTIPGDKKDESSVVECDDLEGESSTELSDTSGISKLQDYKHFVTLVNTPEVSHAEMPQSPHVGRDCSMLYMNQNSEVESYPTFSPKFVEGKSPVVFPPGNPNRNSNTTVLSPPPRDIRKRNNLLTLAPAPKFHHLEKKMDTRGPSDINLDGRLLAFKEDRGMKSGNLLSGEPDSCPSISPTKVIDLTDEFNHSPEVRKCDRPTGSLSVKTGEDGCSIWNEKSTVTEDTNRKTSMPPEVLNKLLQSDNVVLAQPGSSLSSHRYIKSPNDRVVVGRGLSENGLEAVVSDEETNEEHSVLFDEYQSDNIYQTPNQGSIGKLHVKSPLKPINRSRSSNREIESSRIETPILRPSTRVGTVLRKPREPRSMEDVKKEPELQTDSTCADEKNKGRDVEEKSDSKQIQTVAVKKTESSEESRAKGSTLLPDAGTLYLRLRNVLGIELKDFRRHKAQFAIEVDNGQNVSQTPWKPMVREGCIDLDGEFEIILNSNLNREGRIIMTLKCRYEKLIYEPQVEEIVEKVPIGSKRRLFGRKKERYKYQKKLIKKPPKLDKWEYIFARDGSFGRYELVVDADFLEYTRFQVRKMDLDLKNEWSRQYGASGEKPYQLPRRPPYVIGQLNLDACYLSRSSVLERFPRSLSVACGIMSKYESKQGISKEGYLLQKGGDLQNKVTRRFFKLHGNELVGYHEITRKAKIIINLLKVSDVIPPTDLNNKTLDGYPVARNYFQLVFANKEIITFDTEFSSDEKYDWYRKINRVVDLNKSHQPWVKAFYEKSINKV